MHLQLQSLKDGIVVIEMGADALPFLTTLGTLPASLAYFNFYRFTLVSGVQRPLLAGKQRACMTAANSARARRWSKVGFIKPSA